MDSMTITLKIDGKKWCALCGEDIQSGLVGFGDTPGEALIELAIEIDKRY